MSLHAAAPTFDGTLLEVWTGLLNGASLVVLPGGSDIMEGLSEAIGRHGANVAWLTAGLFNTVAEHAPDLLRGMKLLMTGGDAVSVPHIRRVRALLDADATLLNGYGPTETTVFAATFDIPASGLERDHSVPIGRPVPGARLI